METNANSGMSAGELNITHVSVSIEEHDLQGGALKILEVIRPTWEQDNIEFKVRF